nr:HNH endonuclease [Marinobacter salsuginis]
MHWEHLVAHSEGGSAGQSNIVAACRFCNEKRHTRKNPPDPQAYSALVERRLQKGGWNSHLLDLQRQTENRLPVCSRARAG